LVGSTICVCRHFVALAADVQSPNNVLLKTCWNGYGKYASLPVTAVTAGGTETISRRRPTRDKVCRLSSVVLFRRDEIVRAKRDFYGFVSIKVGVTE
jgi:hypothetical protein